MGFGLDIKNKPLEFDKTDWVNYKGIMMPKNTARAKKAWDTIRKKKEKKSYDRTRKNEIRDLIIETINKKRVKDNCFTLLTMDSPEWFFCNSLNKNDKIFVAEKIFETYQKMLKNKPDNVFLYHGDISDFSIMDQDFDIIYLDFCGTFKIVKEIIIKLLPKIKQAKFFGFNFCQRKNQKKLTDYKIELSNELHNIFGNIKYKPILAEPYKDKYHPPMETLFFENMLTTEYICPVCDKIIYRNLVLSKHKVAYHKKCFEKWNAEQQIRNQLKLKQYVKTGKAGYILGVTPETIINWIKTGKIKAVKNERGWSLIPFDEIKRIMKERDRGLINYTPYKKKKNKSNKNNDFTQYKDAKDYLNQTGLSIEDGLKLVESELKKLKSQKKKKYTSESLIKYCKEKNISHNDPKVTNMLIKDVSKARKEVLEKYPRVKKLLETTGMSLDQAMEVTENYENMSTQDLILECRNRDIL